VRESWQRPFWIINPLIRQDLNDSGLVDQYAELNGEVMPCSDDLRVVALCDQWYLDYGEDTWLAAARKALQRINYYHKRMSLMKANLLH
jgi:leucyl-tRNA synthetase